MVEEFTKPGIDIEAVKKYIFNKTGMEYLNLLMSAQSQVIILEIYFFFNC
jgi:hypothetical protein